ncbi:forkhead box protein F-like [Uloborus diversus]|uniref:forkhead box protein F-like n=1 Tax=Uloborus diversus TaxID=327109 RepID=UPI002409063F|nr:forkhead box protein F-like [Uloborus diversus]
MLGVDKKLDIKEKKALERETKANVRIQQQKIKELKDSIVELESSTDTETDSKLSSTEEGYSRDCLRSFAPIYLAKNGNLSRSTNNHYINPYSPPPLVDNARNSPSALAVQHAHNSSMLANCYSLMQSTNGIGGHNEGTEQSSSDTASTGSSDTVIHHETNMCSLMNNNGNTEAESLICKKEKLPDCNNDLSPIKLTSSMPAIQQAAALNNGSHPTKPDEISDPPKHSIIDPPENLTTSPDSGGNSRPPYSYVAMIRRAIVESPEQKLTLQEIYNFILRHFPYYNGKPGWKNSIRHNLSLNKCFIRMPREGGGERKGSYWSFDSAYNDMFEGNNYRRRKRMKRPPGSEGVPNSTSAFGSSFASSFSRPYPYLNPADFLTSGYRSTSERNWSLAVQGSTNLRNSGRSGMSCPSCQRIQPQAFGYVQSSQLDPSVSTASHAYPAHSYVPPTAAFPGHYPAHCSTAPSRYHPY